MNFTCYDDSPTIYNQDVLRPQDSSVVRAILDENGLNMVNVREVVDIQNSVIIMINLSSRSLSKFTLTKSFNNFGIPPSLNLGNNFIDTLFFLDTINNGESIDLANNRLSAIPADIGKLRGQLALYLDNNALKSISPNIMHCNVGYLSVRNNHLVSIPDTISTWITRVSKDSTWQNYQTAPAM